LSVCDPTTICTELNYLAPADGEWQCNKDEAFATRRQMVSSGDIWALVNNYTH